MPDAHVGEDRGDDGIFPDRPNPLTVFVLGILSLTGCTILTGIPAWILGSRALRSSQTYTESELLFCKAGRVMGNISTWIALIALFLYMIVMCSMPSPRRYEYDSPTFGDQRPANLDP